MQTPKVYSFKEYNCIIFCIFYSNFFKLPKNLSTFVHPIQILMMNFREKRKSLLLPETGKSRECGLQAAALAGVIPMQESIRQVSDGDGFQKIFNLLVEDIPDLGS